MDIRLNIMRHSSWNGFEWCFKKHISNGNRPEISRWGTQPLAEEEMIRIAKLCQYTWICKPSAKGMIRWFRDDGWGLFARAKQFACIARVMMGQPNMLTRWGNVFHRYAYRVEDSQPSNIWWKDARALSWHTACRRFGYRGCDSCLKRRTCHWKRKRLMEQRGFTISIKVSGNINKRSVGSIRHWPVNEN